MFQAQYLAVPAYPKGLEKPLKMQEISRFEVSSSMNANQIGVLIIVGWAMVSFFLATHSKIEINETRVSLPILWFSFFTILPFMYVVLTMFTLWLFNNFFGGK